MSALAAGAFSLGRLNFVQNATRRYGDVVYFIPERWTEAGPGALTAGAERHRYAYFPFGAGPRICIGEHFAWMEGVLLLATIAQRWQLRLIPGHRVELLPIITLRAKYGMRMSVGRRTSPPTPLSTVHASQL